MQQTYYKQLVDQLDQGIIGVSPDHRIGYWNKWMETRSHLDAEKVIGRKFLSVFPGLSETRINSALDDALTKGMPAFLSNVFNKSPFPLYDSPNATDALQQSVSIVPVKEGAKVACAINIIDVTAAVRREQDLEQQIRANQSASNELRNKNAILAAQQEASNAGLLMLDCEGRIIGQNKRFNVLWKLPKNPCTGDHAAAVFLTMANLLATPEKFSEMTAALLTGKSGAKNLDLDLKDNRIFEFRRAAMSGDHGEYFGQLLSFRDRTLQKSQEAQLRITQKLSALGKLSGGVAHDYNNMLGVILGYADILQSTVTDDESLEFVNEILRAAERGKKITQKVLGFSQQKPATRTLVHLGDHLGQQASMLRKILTARIDLRLKICEKLWPVSLDQGDLEDAVVNMAINASYAINGNGNFVLTATNTVLDLQGSEEIGLQAGDYVKLMVEDSGSGMNAQTLAQIFDPFFTTKGNQGNGLGLSQVYGFVQRNDGAVTVHSVPGAGSAFSLYFPRHRATPEVSPAPITRVADVGNALGGIECILVVDDEPALRKLAATVLQRNGYEVQIAGGAREALEILKKHAVNLIISDIIMPDVSGHQLAEDVAQLYPDLPVQLTSGYDDEDPECSDQANEGWNVLPKPYTATELLACVRGNLDRGANYSSQRICD